ncbi:hypothetical protein SAY86_030463 [Trapa natans]|uniref:Uncharacterized protein n=1 Tax=Trapa natans TaxID=22666 RepID=A0AAN7RCT8_TRANT|nr:hypothetical protein SAY86_030463 [Trapa natans]
MLGSGFLLNFLGWGSLICVIFPCFLSALLLMVNYWDNYSILKIELELMEENENQGPGLRKFLKSRGRLIFVDYNFCIDACKRFLHSSGSSVAHTPMAASEVPKFHHSYSFL